MTNFVRKTLARVRTSALPGVLSSPKHVLGSRHSWEARQQPGLSLMPIARTMSDPAGAGLRAQCPDDGGERGPIGHLPGWI